MQERPRAHRLTDIESQKVKIMMHFIHATLNRLLKIYNNCSNFKPFALSCNVFFQQEVFLVLS